MTEAKDYLDFLEQHRLMDDAQKYPLVAEYARSCEAEIARLRAALKEIGNQAANINHHCYQTGKLQCVACASSQELIEELARQ